MRNNINHIGHVNGNADDNYEINFNNINNNIKLKNLKNQINILFNSNKRINALLMSKK